MNVNIYKTVLHAKSIVATTLKNKEAIKVVDVTMDVKKSMACGSGRGKKNSKKLH